MGTFTPTMPTSMPCTKARAAVPLSVYRLTPLAKSWPLIRSMACSSVSTCTHASTGPKISSR
ncbi:Uncharacterised protein [Bordetella pertussis]|nr:Uncharacterised protein [Bordetella pertussis]